MSLVTFPPRGYSMMLMLMCTVEDGVLNVIEQIDAKKNAVGNRAIS